MSIPAASLNYDRQPSLVVWEMTRASDPAYPRSGRSFDELSYQEAILLIDEICQIGAHSLIFSRGDCMERKHLTKLIAYAKSCGLYTGAIPEASSALTEGRLAELKHAGLDLITFNLNAVNREDQEAFPEETEGVFQRTIHSIQRAHAMGFRTQVHSLIQAFNESQLDGLFEMLEPLKIALWEILFLVPPAQGEILPWMSGDMFEEVFDKVYDFNRRVDFTIKISEAPHYRRFCHEKIRLQRRIQKGKSSLQAMPRFCFNDFKGQTPAGVSSGKGFAFISYKGDILPSEFLPIAVGNIRKDSFTSVYRETPLFCELRDASLLKGRCGLCPYKKVCGGSRARAYAVTGDYLAADPGCVYEF